MAKFLIIWYFIAVNTYGALMMRDDKRRAVKGKRRTSERMLWLTAIAGAAPMMTIAMRMTRHKTKHLSFKYGFPILAIIDLALYSILLSLLS